MLHLILIAAWAMADALSGTVRDPQGHPLSGARVQLSGPYSAVTKADNEGRYRFPEVPAGAYKVRATQGDLESETPVDLKPNEPKTLDFTLTPQPAFFDPPAFVAAGVTDSSQRGGHGSDPILHSAESLAKATAALAATPESGADALAAIRTAQQRAEQQPTEPNLFDWGAQLLIHRAAEQSTDVFTKAAALYPKSTRILLGLAASWYSRADYERAQRFFFQAADLDPQDPQPYLFLGSARNSPIGRTDGYAQRMRRFAALQPENAYASFYCALIDPEHAEDLLDKALRLDPQLTDAWLQRGILFADRNDLPRAIEAWQKAGNKPEAHYRLARAWRQLGNAEKAKAEITLYESLARQIAEEEDRERARIQEFVFALRDNR
jgi:tetratricopeptide (TPR) repeat protein